MASESKNIPPSIIAPRGVELKGSSTEVGALFLAGLLSPVERYMQEDCELKVNLGYIERLCPRIPDQGREKNKVTQRKPREGKDLIPEK